MKIFKNIIMVVLCAMVLFVGVGTVPCYSADGYVTDSGSAGLADMGEKLAETANAGEDMLVKICLALFPISLLITIVLMLLTKNEKKFAGYLWFCGGVCACTLAVLVIDNGTALAILEKIADALKL